MKPFIYRPINRPRTIRLLKIFPGKLGEPVNVLIRHACIDDSNFPKFSTLPTPGVCMMNDIYRRADEVTVYLGEAQGGEDLAIQLLGRIYDLAKKLREEKYAEEQRQAKVVLPVYQAN
ncbi:hypothetical protein B0T26DRAFT_751763 [Lasiosphaeria miniovina]|uniref:Uncharacterized protein n=1 Tax=Lasiosphaeria miniovina TaxID=1954250 RepID=A0AA40AKY0_9PEZI|nr:uncharacterized protein B0T26DRAFT_751763 [Lasiosphaeria miniovina]KAK0717737.1 hypothetical protein B0T26DRAFT_751763 [Lasiosphaeria miniovina]